MSPAYIAVAREADIASGSGTVVEAAGRQIALFNVDGRFYALENTCLHRGGPVGEGELDGTVVTCPWHGWQYDVTTGRNTFDPDVGLATYPVRLERGTVLVACG